MGFAVFCAAGLMGRCSKAGAGRGCAVAGLGGGGKIGCCVAEVGAGRASAREGGVVYPVCIHGSISGYIEALGAAACVTG